MKFRKALSSDIIEVLFCVAVLFFSGSGLSAQVESSEPVQQVPTLHIVSNLVLIDAIVRDKKTGDLVTDLTQDDFRVEEDRNPQRIESLSHDKLPLSLVFLIDIGDTTSGKQKPSKLNDGWLLDNANGALTALSALRAGDEVAVMTFSSFTQMIQPFTADHAVIADAIRRAADKRSSDADFIDEDVYEAANVARQATNPKSRRVLVFFTDGTSNYYNSMTREEVGKNAPAEMHNHKEALQRLLQTDVSVSGLIDRSPLEKAMLVPAVLAPLSFVELNDVQHFAVETGCPTVSAHGKDVPQKLATLIEEIRSRYTIGFVPVAGQAAGGFHRVKVTLTAHAFQTHPELQRGHVTVEARSGYYR